MTTRPAPPDYAEYRLDFGTVDSEEWKIADYELAYATRLVVEGGASNG